MELSYPDPLANAATLAPHRAALTFRDRVVTFSELREQVRCLSGWLFAQGVRPGERVGIRGPREPDYWIALLALLHRGALPVLLAPDDPRESELRRAAGVERCLQLRPPSRGLSPGDLLLQKRAPVEGAYAPRAWALSDPKLLLFSSGSSGRPKLIRLTSHQLLFSVMGSALRLGHLPGDVWLNCLPLHHVGGISILLRGLIQCITVELHENFSPERVSRRLDSGEVQLISLVPTMLRRLLELRGERPAPSELRAILLGGAPCPEDLLERCRALQLPLSLTWGMSETASQLATRTPGDLSPLESGLPPLASCALLEEEGRLAVFGPLAPKDGWQSSDRGSILADGRVRVLGRSDRFLISGGENVDLEELEQTLRKHPAVLEVAVVAAPDLEWGERPLAHVVLAAPYQELDLEALRAWCAARLPRASMPREFLLHEQLPRTALGKLDRSRLQPPG